MFTGLGRRHDDTKLSGVCLYGYRFNVIFSHCYDAHDISRDVLDFSFRTVDRHRLNPELMVAQLHIVYRVCFHSLTGDVSLEMWQEKVLAAFRQRVLLRDPHQHAFHECN